jgi:hypothetical protein
VEAIFKEGFDVERLQSKLLASGAATAKLSARFNDSTF